MSDNEAQVCANCTGNSTSQDIVEQPGAQKAYIISAICLVVVGLIGAFVAIRGIKEQKST